MIANEGGSIIKNNLTTKDTDVTCYEELESLDLTFTVKNKNRKEMFKEKADKVYFNGANGK